MRMLVRSAALRRPRAAATEMSGFHLDETT
jgi:hypothetical protein